MVNPTSRQKETFGFRTLKTPPPADNKVEDFLADLFNLVADVKFKPASNEFQDMLKKDCQRVRESNKVVVSADKTRNWYEFNADEYQKIVHNNITKSYKKADPESVKKVNSEAARELEIDDRVDAMSEPSAFINIKDHKKSFPAKVEARLINPSKTGIGAVSKQYLDRINSEIRRKTSFNQVKSTSEVLEWFRGIPKTQRTSFFKLDIEAFYPSISENLLVKAIKWARTITAVSRAEERTILHCRKSFLFWEGEPWEKRENKEFDVGQRSLDSAEVSETVGLYILSELRRLIPPENTVLYRDDLLAVTNTAARSVDKLRKDVVKLFQEMGLPVTTEINMRSTDFLDVTLNLEDGSHRPYRKDNKIPVYIDSRSNHPPIVKKNLPKMIGKRILDLSSSKEIFDSEKSIYQEALKNAGFKEKIEYEKSKKGRRRRRSVLWYNPPWSDTVKTNIGESFLRLVDKHFKGDGFLGYHFNRQKVKISYSTMPNMKRIITGHNRRMTDPEEGLKLENCDRKGNCKDQCFEEGGKCQSRCTVYQASLQYEEPHSSIPAIKIPVSKIYTGLSGNKLRERYNHHHWTFSNQKNNPFNQDLAGRNANLQNTTLSTHIWKLKQRKIDYDIKWRIAKQAPVYSKESGGCQLCLEEKTFIMYADKEKSLNKRTEIMQKCRHREDHLLKNK